MTCQACGSSAPTQQVTFIRIIGLLVVWQWKTTRGVFCRDCISKSFWESTAITALFGWWGIISFFMTLVALPVNVIGMLGALSLPRASELGGARGAPLPWPPTPPPGAPPPAAAWPAAAASSSPLPFPDAMSFRPARPDRSTLLLVLGAIGAAFTALWVLLGIGMIVFPTAPTGPKDGGSAQAGVIVLVLFLVVSGIPSGVLLFFGVRGRARAAALRRIAALAATHDPLGLDAIAHELGIDATRARALVLVGVERGVLRGRLDAAAGAFSSGRSPAAAPARPCRSCGAIGVAGTPCPYCGSPA